MAGPSETRDIPSALQVSAIAEVLPGLLLRGRHHQLEHVIA